ncbi:hypothetical protein MKX03_011935 [Papaver bracteatum]|nr:hypothetical protein MKX03_011935 [Papaver bracteatum]
MTKNTSSSNLLVFPALALFAVVMMSEMPVSMAACQITKLTPCLTAFSSSITRPTSDCCRKLKTQLPCFCIYAKYRHLSKYVTSPNARRVARLCKVKVPKCKVL